MDLIRPARLETKVKGRVAEGVELIKAYRLTLAPALCLLLETSPGLFYCHSLAVKHALVLALPNSWLFSYLYLWTQNIVCVAREHGAMLSELFVTN